MTFSKSKNILSLKPKIPHPLDQPADFRFQDVELNLINLRRREWIRTHERVTLNTLSKRAP